MTTDTTNEATGLPALLDRWEAAHERWKQSLRLRRTLPSLVVPATRDLLEKFDSPPPAGAFPKDDGERIMMPMDEFRLAQPDRLSDDDREKAERDLREVLDAWVGLSVQTSALLHAAMAAKHEGITDAHVQDALNASQNLRHRVLFSGVRPLIAKLRDVVDALRVVARNRDVRVAEELLVQVTGNNRRIAILAKLEDGPCNTEGLNAMLGRSNLKGRAKGEWAKKDLAWLHERKVITHAGAKWAWSLTPLGWCIVAVAKFKNAKAGLRRM